MLRIGLTGPTGSGKSTVTALMRQWGGVEVLDADAIAHEVNNSPAAADAIAGGFPGTRLPDGTIILADEISPDTCRFWDSKTHEKLDKDRFRRDLGNVEGAYHEILHRLMGE